MLGMNVVCLPMPVLSLDPCERRPQPRVGERERESWLGTVRVCLFVVGPSKQHPFKTKRGFPKKDRSISIPAGSRSFTARPTRAERKKIATPMRRPCGFCAS